MTSRHWCFTLNNYFKSDIEDLCLLVDDEIARYIVFGQEVAETGTPHLQGYVEFHKPHRMIGAKRIIAEVCNDIQPKLEPRYGTRAQARNYCLKGEQSHSEWDKFREKGPNWGKNAVVHELGSWCTGQGQRTDLQDYYDMVDAVLANESDRSVAEIAPAVYAHHFRGLDRLRCIFEKEHAREFRTVTVHTVIGQAGGGKTRAAAEYDGNVFHVDCSNDQFPFHGYDGERTIALDDFRGGIKYAHLLRILDGHPLGVNIKHGRRHALWDTVIITSNVPPESWYKFGLTPELSRRLHTGHYINIEPEAQERIVPPLIPTRVRFPSSESDPSATVAKWLCHCFKEVGNTPAPPWLAQGLDPVVPVPPLNLKPREDNIAPNPWFYGLDDVLMEFTEKVNSCTIPGYTTG